MEALFQYILKWSVALGVVYIFYRLVLRPLTFYQWNRRYLILYSVIAFFIPFVNLYKYVEPAALQDVTLVRYIPSITIATQPAAAQNGFDPLLAAGIILAAGSLVLLVRLVSQWYSLRRIRRNAVRIYHPHANVYHVNEQVIPFSFGKDIFINTSLHTEQELNDIILHEFVHVRQRHSFDILWSEVLCMLNWYNPFAWLIRHAIRQNLEFIADQSVLQHGLDKKTYQYHLLKVIGSPQYSIANNFNFSSLKKRIAMMNRLKTARVHLVKFIFVLPLLAVLLLAFRNNKGWYQDIVSDTTKPIPQPPKPPAAPKAVSNPGESSIPKPPEPPRPPAPPLPKEFILPEGVSSVRLIKGILGVEYKDGKREVYDLSVPEQKQAAQKKYGEVISISGTNDVILVPGKPMSGTEAKEITVDGKPGQPYKVEEVVVTGRPLEQPVKEVVVAGKPIQPASGNPLEAEGKVIKEVPKVIEVEGKQIKAAPKVIEVQGKPIKQQAPQVIEANGSKEAPASLKVVEENGDRNVIYADRIVIDGNEPYWYVKKQPRPNPVYYINGKRAAPEDVKRLEDMNNISQLEILSSPQLLERLGEKEGTGIINLITKDNVQNKAAYLSEPSKTTTEAAAETSRIANTLHMGVRNPITIKVDGGTDDNIVVKMDGGTIVKENGKYYAIPTRDGNVEILVYKKEGAVMKLINKRVFRVTYAPANNLDT